MSTPQPDTTEVAQPAPSVINWYFGPVRWDQRPDAMWHASCPDPYATGHDGEVWLDHHQGAFCTGCRHYEVGQQEQEIPPQRLAEIPAQPAPWEVPSPATPDPAALPKGLELAAVFQPSTPDPAAATPLQARADGSTVVVRNDPAYVPPQPDFIPAVPAGYIAATQQVMGQTASTMPELPPEVDTLDPTQDAPFTLTGAVPVPADQQAPGPALVNEQPVQAPAQYATEETHPGILGRIRDAL